MMNPASEFNEKGTREKKDGDVILEEKTSLPLELDPNDTIKADEENLPYAEEDWEDPEQREIPKSTRRDLPLTMQTHQSNRERPAKKYNH